VLAPFFVDSLVLLDLGVDFLCSPLCPSFRKNEPQGRKTNRIDKLISLGVDAEFAKMLPPTARSQILNGILGLHDERKTGRV
jgi:hypothetical protein